MKAATKGTCALLPRPWKPACSLAGAASIPSQFRDAAAQGCGLTLKWRATGSSMSYDKAEYSYALACWPAGTCARQAESDKEVTSAG